MTPPVPRVVSTMTKRPVSTSDGEKNRMILKKRLEIKWSGSQPYRDAYDELELWALEFDSKVRMCRSEEGISVFFSHPIDAIRAGILLPDGYKANS